MLTAVYPGPKDRFLHLMSPSNPLQDNELAWEADIIKRNLIDNTSHPFRSERDAILRIIGTVSPLKFRMSLDGGRDADADNCITHTILKFAIGPPVSLGGKAVDDFEKAMDVLEAIANELPGYTYKPKLDHNGKRLLSLRHGLYSMIYGKSEEQLKGRSNCQMNFLL
jgi:hypothetical protein